MWFIGKLDDPAITADGLEVLLLNLDHQGGPDTREQEIRTEDHPRSVGVSMLRAGYGCQAWELILSTPPEKLKILLLITE